MDFFVGKLWHSGQNCFVLVKSDRFGRNFFIKDESLQVISAIERKNFGVWQKFFQQCCRNCILCVQRNCLRKSFLKNNFFWIFFEIRQKNFRPLSRIFYCRIVKIAIYMSMGYFWGNNILVINFFCIFQRWTLGKKVTVYGQNFSAGLSKLAFYLSIGSIWGGSFLMEKNFFFIVEHWAKFFGLLVSKIGKVDKTAF